METKASTRPSRTASTPTTLERSSRSRKSVSVSWLDAVIGTQSPACITRRLGCSSRSMPRSRRSRATVSSGPMRHSEGSPSEPKPAAEGSASIEAMASATTPGPASPPSRSTATRATGKLCLDVQHPALGVCAARGARGVCGTLLLAPSTGDERGCGRFPLRATATRVGTGHLALGDSHGSSSSRVRRA